MSRSYRLLAADIDGTIVTSRREVPPGVLSAVRAAQSRGVRVLLATGRIWMSAEPYIRRVHLDYAHARAVLEILRAFPEVQPHVYVGDRVYAGTANELTERYRRKDGLPVEEVGDLIEFLPRDPMKILIIGARPDLERVAAEVRAHPMPINTVFSEETYFEVLPAGSSKGVALRFVAEHLRIPLSAVIAVGDNLNDLEMIQTAGLGVAMGNAPEALKVAAGYVAPTNDEEGLADVIERFITQGRREHA